MQAAEGRGLEHLHSDALSRMGGLSLRFKERESFSSSLELTGGFRAESGWFRAETSYWSSVGGSARHDRSQREPELRAL